MKTSESINELAAALAIAQGEIRAAEKDKTNPHFGAKYSSFAAMMDAVRVPLSKNGLALIMFPSVLDLSVTVTTLLAHKSGQFVENELTLRAAQNTPQAIGSALTYAKRYSMALVGITSDDDDDDGNAASAKPSAVQRKPAPAVVVAKAADDDMPPVEYPPAPTQSPYDIALAAWKTAKANATAHGMENEIARFRPATGTTDVNVITNAANELNAAIAKHVAAKQPTK